MPNSSPPSPPPPPSAPTPADTAGPSYIAQQSPEHIHVSSRELVAVMDAVCALGVVGPAVSPSRGYYRAQSRHASSDHEPPRSPA